MENDNQRTEHLPELDTPTPGSPGEKRENVWHPMSEYPRDFDHGARTYWGPTVLVRTPDSKVYPYGPTYHVAHLEADMWLARDPGDPVACTELHAAPIAFMLVKGLLE
jgi:hypothetical protein